MAGNKLLIDSLNSEIAFLRNELLSKDRELEMVLKGRDTNCNHTIQEKVSDNRNYDVQRSSSKLIVTKTKGENKNKLYQLIDTVNLVTRKVLRITLANGKK